MEKSYIDGITVSLKKLGRVFKVSCIVMFTKNEFIIEERLFKKLIKIETEIDNIILTEVRRFDDKIQAFRGTNLTKKEYKLIEAILLDKLSSRILVKNIVKESM